MAEQNALVARILGVHAARGSLRDGLAALQNLETLLRSPRIGPRTLEPIVSELRSGCPPLGDALSVLIGDIAHHKPEPEVAAQLSDLADANVLELDAALVRASSMDLGAKARLALEADVHRIGCQLGTLRGLIDLLQAATPPQRTELVLNELVTASVSELASHASYGPEVTICTRLSKPSAQLMTDVRVVMPLIALMLGLVTDAGGETLELATIGSDVDCWVRVRPCTADQQTQRCRVPRVLGPSLQVAQLTASQLGGTLEFDRAQCSCSLQLETCEPSSCVRRIER